MALVNLPAKNGCAISGRINKRDELFMYQKLWTNLTGSRVMGNNITGVLWVLLFISGGNWISKHLSSLLIQTVDCHVQYLPKSRSSVCIGKRKICRINGSWFKIVVRN
jgi:hypothetical protein